MKDAADACRPAAIKQLQILGESIGVEAFSIGTDADPVKIAAAAVLSLSLSLSLHIVCF
jgi:signal recognition particle subunit SRP54